MDSGPFVLVLTVSLLSSCGGPFATSAPATVEQVKRTEPGIGWFCYRLSSSGAFREANCFRDLAACEKERDAGAASFGFTIGYSHCERRSTAECFVFRRGATIVQARCLGARESCENVRKGVVEERDASVGGLCVTVD